MLAVGGIFWKLCSFHMLVQVGTFLYHWVFLVLLGKNTNYLVHFGDIVLVLGSLKILSGLSLQHIKNLTKICVMVCKIFNKLINQSKIIVI